MRVMHSRIWTDSDFPMIMSSHFESIGFNGAEGSVEGDEGDMVAELRTPQAKRSVSVSLVGSCVGSAVVKFVGI